MAPGHRDLVKQVAGSKVNVDQRLSLKYYYRTADNLLKQANIYRLEENTVELYVILIRFSSLLLETIPAHKEYKSVAYSSERAEFQKRLLQVLQELEVLKPQFMSIIKSQRQQPQQRAKAAAPSVQSTAGHQDFQWPPLFGDSSNVPPPYFPTSTSAAVPAYYTPPSSSYQSSGAGTYQRSGSGQLDLLTGPSPSSISSTYSSSAAAPTNWASTYRSAYSLPPAREETLSRHSFLSSLNRPRKEYSLPAAKVSYPSYIDATPLDTPWRPDLTPQPVPSTSAPDPSSIDISVLSLSDPQPAPMPILAQPLDIAPDAPLIPQPAVPPLEVPVTEQPRPENVADPRPGPADVIEDKLVESKGPKPLHFSNKMMDEFMKLALANTKRNLETCAVLAGSLKQGTFYVTTLIVPKQESTSDSCNTIHEEEIFETQDKRDLFQLGWIHTHPSQSCFMSSVDLHTHYSYQVMLPEAIAIVMAPTDSSRKYGVFRLSDPGGIKVIQNCNRRGFHPHDSPADGSPLYQHCSHVFMNPNLQFDLVDLRQR